MAERTFTEERKRKTTRKIKKLTEYITPDGKRHVTYNDAQKYWKQKVAVMHRDDLIEWCKAKLCYDFERMDNAYEYIANAILEDWEIKRKCT